MRSRRLLLPGLVFALSLLLAVGVAEAGEEANGALYVASYVDVATAEQTPGTRTATVFVYDAKGAKVSSGKGNGGWSPGDAIPLAPGEYWVGIGTHESKEGLYRYTVESGKTTVVETGWVSVATLPPSEQPSLGCTTWFAKLRAYAFHPTIGKGELLSDNSDTRPQEFGSIQLHPGIVVVEFHGFSGLLQVEAGHDYRLPTGFFGPTTSQESYLIVRKDDDARRKGLAVCGDDAIHVLAGQYFVHEMVRMDEGATIDWVTEPVEVEPVGNHGSTKLKRERAPGEVRKPDIDDGTPIQPDEFAGLTEWGKKKSEFSDLELFGD